MSRSVCRIEFTTKTGAIGIVTIKVLEAESIGIIRNKLIVSYIIAQGQAANFIRRQSGTIAAICQLEVINVCHITVIGGVIRIVIVVIYCDKSRTILNINQIIFIGTIIDRHKILTIIIRIVSIIIRVI